MIRRRSDRALSIRFVRQQSSILPAAPLFEQGELARLAKSNRPPFPARRTGLGFSLRNFVNASRVKLVLNPARCVFCADSNVTSPSFAFFDSASNRIVVVGIVIISPVTRTFVLSKIYLLRFDFTSSIALTLEQVDTQQGTQKVSNVLIHCARITVSCRIASPSLIAIERARRAIDLHKHNFSHSVIGMAMNTVLLSSSQWSIRNGCLYRRDQFLHHGFLDHIIPGATFSRRLFVFVDVVLR